jgi:hypothetical protein
MVREEGKERKGRREEKWEAGGDCFYDQSPRPKAQTQAVEDCCLEARR